MQQFDKSIIVILPLVIYLFSFLTLLYNLDFYNSLFVQTNVDVAQALSLTKELFDYFKNNNYAAPTIKTLTENENSHILDVKILLTASVIIFCLLLTITIFKLSRAKQKRQSLLFGCLVSLFLPLLFFLVDFSYLFTVFHRIFFPQGNWLFPQDAVLVSVYAADFFYLFAFRIILRGMLISVVFLVFAILTNLYAAQQQNI